MNTTQDGGGPAFPVAPTLNPDGTVWYHGKDGMSLRDWFAGMALIRLIHDWCKGDPKHADTCADAAYKFADAMLLARKEAR